MKEFVITADSNCDLPESYIAEIKSVLSLIIMFWMKSRTVMK
jgi:hypothetical protein